MDKSEYSKIDSSITFLIHQLFGQESYREIKGSSNITIVRKYYLKLLKSFLYAINETIEVSDKNQIKDLHNILSVGENSLKKCETMSELDHNLITIQTKLIFQLLGEIPNRNRMQKKIINRKEQWRLNTCRQIQYVQNQKNIGNMIFNIIQYKYIDRFGDFENFIFIYQNECNNNLNCLIEYLKNKHPDIFNEVF